MAQLKDLIVSGPARIIGDLYGSNIYATTFIGGLNGTASNAVTAGGATTASQATHAQTAHYATSATYASSAGSAATATNAAHSQTAHYATSAAYSSSAGSATSATNAAHAQTAHFASTANTAATASNATTSGYAITATNALHAQTAHSAGSATYASSANYAMNTGRIYRDFNLTTTGTSYAADTDVITKTVSTSGYNFGAYSKIGYSSGCCISFYPAATAKSFLVGLKKDLSSLSDLTIEAYSSNFDIAIQFDTDGTFCIRTSGTSQYFTENNTYSLTDQFRIELSNGYIKFYKNDQRIPWGPPFQYGQTIPWTIASSSKYYAFCCLYSQNAAVKNLSFDVIPSRSIICIESMTGVLTIGSY